MTGGNGRTWSEVSPYFHGELPCEPRTIPFYMMAPNGEIEYEEIAHLLLGPDQGVA
ncbi:MAG: hypothetical protein RJA29_817 [Pseudomonadota bacterium]